MTTIDRSEHERRLAAVRAALDERGLDALLAYGPPEQPGPVTYLTGWTPVLVPVFCVVTAERCLLIASDIEWGETKGPARAELVEIAFPRDQVAAIAAALRDAGRVGIAGWNMLPAPVAFALGAAPDGRLAPTDALDAVRLVKSPVELELMRAAARVADAGADAFAAAVAGGAATDVEVGKAVEGAMRDAGLLAIMGPTVVGVGANGADVTMTPVGAPIREGELVLLDNACWHGGYCADLARATLRGEPSPELRRMLETTLLMYEEGRALLQPGGLAEAVHDRCREIAEEAGYEYPYGTGHSIGTDFHEWPEIGTGTADVVLAADMVVCIEPGLYVPGVGGLRFENTIHVTADGPVDLTRSPLVLWE
jgi:Xaa-Pro aminopeptidase